MRKFLIIISVIFLSVFAFFFSNIKGYYRFKQYCEAEGGLRVYEPLERNVGWSAADYNDAHVAAQFNHTAFVRYEDKGVVYDLRYLGGDPQFENSFERKNFNETNSVLYEIRSINYEGVEDVPRLYRFGYEVLDVKTKKILGAYYMFSYSIFDREKTILAGPSGIDCFHEISQDGNAEKILKAINGLFRE